MRKGTWIATWVLGLSASLLLVSCGGGSSDNTSPPPATVSISISPTTASVQTGATQQFTATVTGTSDSAVTWQVNDTAGGDSTNGTVSATGLYTAPAAVPSPATVTVTAVSSADSTKTASATVTLSTAPVAVTLTPTQVVVQVGKTLQFTGSATGGSGVTTVTYTLSGGSGDLGTISADGLYTAPATLPSPVTVTVTATADADGTTTATATITVSLLADSNATLNGSYAFRLRGEDANGYFQAVGNMAFDGAGNVTGGEEDLNYGVGVFTQLALTGTYSVDGTGHGSATLTNSQYTFTIAFEVLSPDHVKFISLDGSQGSSGEMEKQDNTAFSTSAITGNFSFGFDGFDAVNGNPSSYVGRFTADGAGNITNGLEDSNENSAYSASVAFTGTYSVDSTGRGTATFNTASDTRTFAFQVISADTLYFMELEYVPNLEGTAKKQTVAFTKASLSGDYAFLMALPDTTYFGETATAGRFTSDGAGNISSGVLDQNNNGTTASSVAFTGTYNVAASGRGTASVSSTSPAMTVGTVFYMVSAQEGYIMSIDPNTVQSGPLLAQQGGPFDNTTLSGPFALLTVDSLDNTWTLADVAIDGAGNLSGTDYTNHGGTLGGGALTGTYSVDATGRGTTTVMDPSTTSNLVFYVVSGSKALVVQMDSSATAAGTLDKMQ